MSEIKLTSNDSFAITVDGEIRDGQVFADLRPSAVTGDALQKTENLADLQDKAAARTNIGMTATGQAVATAASGDAAMTAMGITANGRNIIKAADGSTARIYLGLGSFRVTCTLPDIVSANAAKVQVFVGGGSVVQAWAASTVPVAGADLTFTVKYGGTALPTVNNGTFHIAVGSQTGHITYTNDASNNIANPNVPLEIDIGGGNTAAGLVNLTLDISPPGVG